MKPGDQVKQSLVLKNLEKDYENIVVVCDKRLKMSMQRANPCFTYHSEFDGDYLRCYAQDLFCKYNHIHNNVYISLVANEHLVQYWQEIFALSNKKYIVGLCQGSHLYTVDRLINHFNVSDYEMIIESFTDVLFVNIGINEFNHKNVIDLNIDRKNDLESLIAVMECCDIIITSPNSLLDIAGGMGKYVLAISSTKKHEWRYGKNFDDFYHKKTKWIVAKDITNKRETISRAKNWLSNFLSKKSFYGVLDESFFCGVNGNADDEKIAKIGQALRNINEIEKSIDFLEKYIDKESLLIFNELSYSYAIIKDDMNVYRVLSMAYRSRKISEKMLKRYLDNLQKIKYIDIYRQILNEISNSPFQNSKYLQEHLTL